MSLLASLCLLYRRFLASSTLYIRHKSGKLFRSSAFSAFLQPFFSVLLFFRGAFNPLPHCLFSRHSLRTKIMARAISILSRTPLAFSPKAFLSWTIHGMWEMNVPVLSQAQYGNFMLCKQLVFLPPSLTFLCVYSRRTSFLPSPIIYLPLCSISSPEYLLPDLKLRVRPSKPANLYSNIC